MEKKAEKKQILPWWSYVIMLLAGFSMAALSDLVPAIANYKHQFLYDSNHSFDLFNVLVFIFLIVLAYNVQIIIHETGHLVFGLLSGYRFVSFRIRSFMLVRMNGKLCIKRFSIPGTKGQCLMSPPQTDISYLPYALYNFGGVIFNLLAGILSLWLMQITFFPWDAFFFFVCITGFFIILLNGIPMKIGGIPNDGSNFLILRNDETSKKSFFVQLKTNELLTNGMRLKEMPSEWFVLPSNANLANSFHSYIKTLEAGREMDAFNFHKARVCLKELEPHLDKVYLFLKKEIQCELLFLEIILTAREDVIHNLASELLPFIEQNSKFLFSKLRLLYTYTLLVEKDEAKAALLLDEARKMELRYPLKGEAQSEMELMAYVQQRKGANAL